METKVQRWGNCLAVRIPRAFARDVGLVSQSAIELRLVEGRIVVEANDPAPALEELLSGVTPSNAHRDLGWRPVPGE
jgi:antitoxin MazE